MNRPLSLWEGKNPTETHTVKQNRPWFLYAMIIVVAWGIWGAWSDYPSKQEPPFPMTLVYVVWALTLILPALVALRIIGWKPEHDVKSIILGCAAGLLGAGGQLILFPTLDLAPAYLLFPFIALSPVVTIVMALIISKERATTMGWAGIALAVVAGVLLAVPPDYGQEASKQDAPATKTGDAPSEKPQAKHDAPQAHQQAPQKSTGQYLWVVLALLILLAWGLQGFVISHANRSMKAESIFFYMMLTGVLLIPAALAMTDFSKPINWGLKGPPLTAAIQILNSVGALLLVYTFRYGKAIIVSPLTNAGAPVITVIISLVLASLASNLSWTTGAKINAVGIVLAVVATVLMAIEGEKGGQT
jgi:drug/metabolite transporter (DMT)-like permease